MRSTFTILLAAVLGVSVRGAETLCNGEPVKVASFDHTVAGKTIQMTEYSCPDGFSTDVLRKAGGSYESTTISQNKTSLEARQSGSCLRYDPPICQSTTPCTDVYCSSNGYSPRKADCDELSDWLSYQTGTFLTNPRTYVEAGPYLTCVFRWANLSGGILEYSYSDWAYLGSRVNSICTIENYYANGLCLAPGSLWFAEVYNPQALV